jgi:hypothetical protein
MIHTNKNENNLLCLKQMIVDINYIYKISSCQKPHVFSHMWNADLLQIQQYYEKQVTIRRGHIQEGKGKRRKLRRLVWLMYSLHNNEYRIF